MWLPIIFLMIGLLLGFMTDVTVPDAYSHYLAVVVLAGFDTLLGGARAHLNKHFSNPAFIGGFLFNVGIASCLVFFGKQLGVELYLAVVFALGVRMFNNLGRLRRILIDERIISKK
ncbi:small basic family protein [Halobacillus sp. B23F22_1]|uniref:small basic family protein n=1 Tax=Halobacillus sp. B23F22_1 TaxID=3459514 RepID=UPI00373E08B4